MVTKRKPSREVYTDVVLAIHGGAGVITEDVVSASDEKQYRKHLEAALKAGFRLLQKGKSSLHAVEAAVNYLEDCPLFNAGRGAVFTHEGTIQLDAAVMDGATHAAGAIACVTNIKNPVTAARTVMEQTGHVLLVGEGAEKFARMCGLEIVDPAYFHTDRQRERLQRALAEEKERRRHAPSSGAGDSHPGKNPTSSHKRHPRTRRSAPAIVENKYGTVGAVSVDADGNLAAGTSTGGTFNKRFGRVGDSPIIGAGTYADNATCAVSATGHGEFFMRHVAAYDVAALMKYKRMSLPQAAWSVIEQLADVGGSGGLIAIDANGNCALPFNSEGMFRGCITANGEAQVSIFKD